MANAPMTLLIGFAMAGLVAGAQMTGGQRRSRLEAHEQPEPVSRATRMVDPVFALERELPSLRTDLKLDGAQDGLWGPFERSVRDAAELTRQRMKKMMAPRPADAPAPDAAGLVAALADNERMRAEAMAKAVAHLKALCEAITPAQRLLLDRRVLLSQSEPLGAR